MDHLPYRLTGAQQRVWDNICSDLNLKKTVFRLIQGDVGSGKTDIAILSLLVAVANGYKAAILVPTEILAEQHFIKLQSRCSEFAKIFLLKGKQTKKERQIINDALTGDAPLIVVGTHALVQDGVDIHQLGMVIIDEQHRFGVFQRQKLLEKSDRVPHCLFMSATPIPRTLMLTHYGDLDHDVIDELPPGRKSPKTYYASPNRLQQIFGLYDLNFRQNVRFMLFILLLNLLSIWIQSYLLLRDLIHFLLNFQIIQLVYCMEKCRMLINKQLWIDLSKMKFRF